MGSLASERRVFKVVVHVVQAVTQKVDEGIVLLALPGAGLPPALIQSCRSAPMQYSLAELRGFPRPGASTQLSNSSTWYSTLARWVRAVGSPR